MKVFASKTRSRIMHLKEQLSHFVKDSKLIAEYVQGIKSLVDELTITKSPVDDVDLVIHNLNGLRVEIKEVSAAIHNHEIPIIFNEHHDLLTNFKAYLQRSNIAFDISIVVIANAAPKGKHYSSKPPVYSIGSSSHCSISMGKSKKVIS